ncbi:MAG: EamA family transporter [Synergistaceae bacterium]|nr:EamA family transporter [Synergistaceae bacterium]
MKDLLSFITAMLIFGTIGILRRFIPLSSAVIAFFRGILGSLFLLVFLKFKRRPLTLPDTQDIIKLALSGAFLGINWLFLFEAYNFTSVPIATLFCYTNPAIVIILSAIFLGERLTARKCLCLMLSLTGMLLISGVIESGLPGQDDIKGILCALASASLYASVVIMNKRVKGAEIYAKTIIQLSASALVMVPYIIFTSGFASGEWNAASLALLLYAGIVNTGIAYVLYFGSMNGLSAGTIAFFSYIDPVTALILAAVILGESLTLTGLAGAALILASSVISELAKNS